MAETPKRAVHSTRSSKQPPSSATKPLPSLTPSTPQTSTPRRSTRRTSLSFDSETPRKQIDLIEKAIGDSVKETPRDAKTPRRKSSGIPKTPDVKTLDSAKKDKKPNRKGEKGLVDDKVSLSPVSPEQPESRKRKRENGRTVVTRAMASKGKSSEKKKKVVHDGGEFEVGDDVYVRRREGASSDDEDPEMEECRVCFKSGKAVMIECDDCLGGFHLKCLKPPLKEVPEGDWICWFCEAGKMGKRVQLPVPTKGGSVSKKRVHYKKVVHDGGEFEVGDDVYVRRREYASSDDEDPEMEECRVCFKSGKAVMIECDDCLGGFHLKCLKPPLKEVPEGDWICWFCEARKMGKRVQLPVPPKGKKLVRTMREKLLSSDLWAARIERIWKEVDGSYWCSVRWYIIPEETSSGRQPHNLKRELYRTNDFADIEMECVLRHCFVKNPKEYTKASDEGDDVFLCEYEYDIHWHSFKCLAEIDDDEEDADSDEDWKVSKDVDSDTNAEETDSNEHWKVGKDVDSGTDDVLYDEEESIRNIRAKSCSAHKLAANSRKGRFFGLEKVGMKKIPEHVRCHKRTELERAKAALVLASMPKCLPCRNKEMEEITSFIKDAICDDQCLGRCLYIHGVPGTGKTMSVLTVMKNLRSEVDARSIRPYCFVEINGLKLASPENIYRVVYEALSGHRVSWKKALQLLNDRFSEGKKFGKEDDRPCILLIDELDLLVTRNQSVLYNILDWPTKPHSKLIVIGIANTMDLPEKLLPRISSRMGIQRLCFGPYNFQQLQEIILSRLKGIDAFEKQAIEFASRKVAAISGDARRALEICRRAAEITDYRVKKLRSNPINASEGKAIVGMADVEAAIQEMFQAPHIQVMRSSCKLSKIFLTSMVHELYKMGMGETTFEKLAMTVSCLCTSNGEAFPGHDTLLRVGCKLGECRIILCESGAKHRLQKLQLNFPSDDVAFALKDSKELPWLTKYL
ncbi:origin of replication complex subunit 1A [Morus notabilis]|uniref:origin of replication complex subunit 1A n=1 Tax=Morus notabilis TaxID=981085 RepID=UPI000CED79A7|nr:origin of replication complex subunit 1A [Morus notabilis]